MARAFVTAVTHEDQKTRERADSRTASWSRVLAGIARGELRVGSRQPTADLPIWATPKVLRGGFATGEAHNGGELADEEQRLANHLGVPPERGRLFAYYLTEQGLAELNETLERSAYRVEVPEDAALLVLAWLVGAGETARALDLATSLAPFADRLRFAPRRSDPSTGDRSMVFRATAGETEERLRNRRENRRVAVMRESLTVWNPFADDLLSHWLLTEDQGKVAARFPSGWQSRARDLLRRYVELAELHTLATKHRNPKENIAILRSALEAQLETEQLDPRLRGLLQHAVDSMVKRRGRPGSAVHSAARETQRRNASVPTHRDLTQLVVRRLAEVPADEGLDDPESFTRPVRANEVTIAPSLVVGAEIPAAIKSVVDRTLRGTPESLIEAGIVPSAEVLAELIPRLAATVVSARYADEALARLMSANYEAFRRRRSLLLLNLEHQVTLEELPWVQALPGSEDAGSSEAEARATLVRVAELAITAFPGTILPNPLITELEALSREAGLDIPFVEEIASDIFMGQFSGKFVRAAKLAGDLLDTSLYARYYGIDYAEIDAISDVSPRTDRAAATSVAFNDLCFRRAGADRASIGSVARNGTVIEQAQIVTTHNLAALLGPSGPSSDLNFDWDELAARALGRTRYWLDKLDGKTHPLRAVKNAAFAWRQLVFFLSQLEPSDQRSLVSDGLTQPSPVLGSTDRRLEPVLGGLRHVVEGGVFDPVGRSPDGRRFLGWSVDVHWMLGGQRQAP